MILSWPWKRKIMHVSDFGAISNDGKDDWKGIYNAVNAACLSSKEVLVIINYKNALIVSLLVIQ